MNYTLPRALDVGGRKWSIRWDFRAVLDIMTALDDPDLNDQERAYVALYIFYPELEKMPPETYEEALKRLFWFVNGGQDQDEVPGTGSARLMDWEQDFPLIVAPVNRVLGRDIRGDADLHWWTFLSAFYEIGDCTFAQVVSVRDKQARGKKLEKPEREWYRRNKSLVDFRRKSAQGSTQKYTRAEQELLSKLL